MLLLYFWLSCFFLGVDHPLYAMCFKGWTHWYVTTFCHYCSALGFGDDEGQAAYYTAHQMYFVWCCDMNLSFWFHFLVLFMHGFWFWILSLMRIDFLLTVCLYRFSSISILTCCIAKYLPFLYAWLVPGLWKVYIRWLSLFFVNYFGFDLFMVRGHKESPLWSKTSPWKHFDGLLASVYVWPLGSKSVWLVLDAVLFLGLCAIFLCLFTLPILLCVFWLVWTYDSPCFFLFSPTLFIQLMYGLLCDGSFSCTLLGILLLPCPLLGTLFCWNFHLLAIGVSSSWIYLDLPLSNYSPLIMCLVLILALVSDEAHSFLIVHYVSDFFVLGSCAVCILDILFGLDCWV